MSLNPLVPRGCKNKNSQTGYNWLFWLNFKGSSTFWHSLLWALETSGLKRSVLAPCNFCFLKTINYIEVQKYLFGINGLIYRYSLGDICKPSAALIELSMRSFNLFRGHSQDHRPSPPLLHSRVEPVRLCPRDSQHRGHPHGGPHDRLSRVADTSQGRKGLQDRKDTEADQGQFNLLLYI